MPHMKFVLSHRDSRAFLDNVLIKKKLYLISIIRWCHNIKTYKNNMTILMDNTIP